MKNWLCTILILALLAVLSGCGDSHRPAKSGGTMKTVIKTTALSAGLNIGAVQMALSLPNGVTPPFNPDGSISSAAVEFTSSAPASYIVQKATFNAAGSLFEFSIVDLAGFATDDQIVIHLNVADGIFPRETDFSLFSYSFYDKVTGAPITGLSPVLTTTIQ